MGGHGPGRPRASPPLSARFPKEKEENDSFCRVAGIRAPRRPSKPPMCSPQADSPAQDSRSIEVRNAGATAACAAEVTARCHDAFEGQQKRIKAETGPLLAVGLTVTECW